jgi:hypothetical protein
MKEKALVHQRGPPGDGWGTDNGSTRLAPTLWHRQARGLGTSGGWLPSQGNLLHTFDAQYQARQHYARQQFLMDDPALVETAAGAA